MKNRASRIAVIVAVVAAGAAGAGGIAFAHDHNGHHDGHHKFVSSQDYNTDDTSGDDAGLGVVQGLAGVH